MRLVLDTNVVVSAFLWEGSPRELLKLCSHPSVEASTSIPLMLELSATLGKPKFAKKIAASRLSVSDILAKYAALAEVVRPVEISGLVRDPDDDVVVGTALAARADLLVSGDRHLLDLVSYGSIRIVNVSNALEALADL
jgi:putative PIN family toxin of toxin-antitoxin system